jgi:hypothetical protein
VVVDEVRREGVKDLGAFDGCLLGACFEEVLAKPLPLRTCRELAPRAQCALSCECSAGGKGAV